jgi:hypothetical protein
MLSDTFVGSQVIRLANAMGSTAKQIIACQSTRKLPIKELRPVIRHIILALIGLVSKYMMSYIIST